MRRKPVLYSFILVLAVLLIGATGVSADDDQQITVYGTGNVTLQPDLVTIEIGVVTKKQSIQEAISENTETVAAVKKALLSLGIQEADIATANYSVYSQNQMDSSGSMLENQFTFTVNYNFKITQRDIAQLNETLDVCFDQGANNLYNITFDSTQRKEAVDKARELAIDEANANAEKIAEKLDVKILGIKSFSIRDYPVTSNVAAYKMEMAAGSAPVSSGDLIISTTVDIVYRITD